jgi:hypothetical protein
MISDYIARVASWAASGLNVLGPKWRSTGGNKDPHQTHSISGIQTRKTMGENQTPKPKPADIRPEPDQLPSLVITPNAQLEMATGRVTVPETRTQNPKPPRTPIRVAIQIVLETKPGGSPKPDWLTKTRNPPLYVNRKNNKRF